MDAVLPAFLATSGRLRESEGEGCSHSHGHRQAWGENKCSINMVADSGMAGILRTQRHHRKDTGVCAAMVR